MQRSYKIISAMVLSGLLLGLLAYFGWYRQQERRLLAGPWSDESVIVVFSDQYLTLIQVDDKGQLLTQRLYYTLDTTTAPKRITTHNADGPSSSHHAEAECYGIYERHGEQLRLCIGKPGGPCPTAFDAHQGRMFELSRTH